MPNVHIPCLSIHHCVGENSHTSTYAYPIHQSVTGPLDILHIHWTSHHVLTACYFLYTLAIDLNLLSHSTMLWMATLFSTTVTHVTVPYPYYSPELGQFQCPHFWPNYPLLMSYTWFCDGVEFSIYVVIIFRAAMSNLKVTCIKLPFPLMFHEIIIIILL